MINPVSVLFRFKPRSLPAFVRSLSWCAALVVCAPAARAQSPRVVIAAQPGYTIAWDGNNGGFFDLSAGASAPDNIGLAAHGTIPFGSSEYNGGGDHLIVHINDGLYGNERSWIPDFTASPPDTNLFIGEVFTQAVGITNIAWSRDNGDATQLPCAGGICMDRYAGAYVIQFTLATDQGMPTLSSNSASLLVDTEIPATGWATVGSVTYLAGTDNEFFSGYLRHRFDISTAGKPIQATALRIKVANNGIDMDELEVNDPPDPNPPLSSFIQITNTAYTVQWDGNDGVYSSSNTPAAAPQNLALASTGTTAFSSSDFAGHPATNVIDGLYGDANGWIANFAASPADSNPFIGLNFGKFVWLSSIAWGRDNTLKYADRSLGVYTLQFTDLANPGKTTAETGDPATGWATLGTVAYLASGDPFHSSLRHSFTVSTNGAPIEATGIRIKVPNANISMDEIEVDATDALTNNLIQLAPNPGFNITWDGNDGEFYKQPGGNPPDNLALTTYGTAAFASSFYGDGNHGIAHLNDDRYGDSHGWIPNFNLPDNNPLMGLSFGATSAVSSVAWGRDNTGTYADRSLGAYTLEYTLLPNPDENTAESGDPTTGFVQIGNISYLGSDATFRPWVRHRFGLSQGGQPILATGLRFLLPNDTIAVDELEVNPSQAPPPPPAFIFLTNGAGYKIAWDGNDGQFFNTNLPAYAPANAASPANGTVAFGSSELNAGGVHLIKHINDGLYGNTNSWIANFGGTPPDTNAFVGLNFGRRISIGSVAWSRDNTGTYADRWQGIYTLQITRVANPGTTTTETGDANSGWATVGVVDYEGSAANFHPARRHRFDLTDAAGNPVVATGFRMKVSSNQIDLDEVEIDPAENMLISPTAGYTIGWNGNEGDFYNPNPGAGPPDNIALAIHGTVAFGSSEYGHGIHLIAHVNNGLYGNSESWIPDFTAPDMNPFVGVNFGAVFAVTNLAWSRDNGDQSVDPIDGSTEACGGSCHDRSVDVYTLQYTLLTSADANTSVTENATNGWATIGTIQYLGQDSGFTPWLRHQYSVSAGGAPLMAAALRILTGSDQTDIDEMEVDVTAAPPAANQGPVIAAGQGYSVVWDGNDGDYYSPAAGAAPPDNAALTSHGSKAFGSSELGNGGVDLITHINDGLYGNNHSWIPNFAAATPDTNAFVGVSFGSMIAVTNVAWSRDNGDMTDPACGGSCQDRWESDYTIQFTQAQNPDATTPETGDAATGWKTIGTVTYNGANGIGWVTTLVTNVLANGTTNYSTSNGGAQALTAAQATLAGAVDIGTASYFSQAMTFHPWLRHRFDLSATNGPIMATGLRLKVSNDGTDLDELEVDSGVLSVPQLVTPALLTVLHQGPDIQISWTGGGALQSADQVTGPWTVVSGATSPQTIAPPLAAQKFYRIKLP